LTVVATVDENGRVLDYRVISELNEETALILPQLKNVLITSQFRPATKFGQPTTDRVVLSFSKINVKG
jgi:2,3-bisphosphoglycerate-independent phosphoglycerate mutase